jgi:tetratricopeptide (TPR) repeat protein
MSLAAKHRKQAAEYEKQQDFERALTAYTAAIQESDQAREEVDVALFNKVGDLALRLGRIPEAMTHYERAVDQYSASGRFNNAIALCNKIKRTTPNWTGIYLTLGRICARKGLRGDASSNFLDYATRMQQDGRTDEARRALVEVAALFPDIPELQRLVMELGDGSAAAEGAPTHASAPVPVPPVTPTPPGAERKLPGGGGGLVFLDVDAPVAPLSDREMRNARVPTPISSPVIPERSSPPVRETIGASLEEHLLFDPAVDRRDASPPSPIPLRTERPQALPQTEPDAAAAAHADEPPGASLLDPASLGGDPYGVGLAAGADAAWELPPLVIPLEGMEAEAEGLGSGESVPSLDALLVEETLADSLSSPQPESPAPVVIPTPRDIAMPGMAQAIAEGERLVATAESQSVLSVLVAVEAAMTPLPPFRVNPHDFILPGELPPLLLDDAHVDGALAGTGRGLETADAETAHAETAHAETAHAETADVERADVERAVAPPAADATEPADAPPRPEERTQAEVWEDPADALQAAVEECCALGRWSDAAATLEQLVAAAPDRLWAHQRRVEVALRLGGGPPLRDAYLALGAVLARRGDDAAARAVSARVLALFPGDGPVGGASGAPREGTAAPGRVGDGAATRIRVAEPEATGDDAVDFEVVLRLFKDGVARSLGEEDAGSRYDLGVAYKEMGLLDDAVAEFQKAVRSPLHRLPAYEALGQCFVEQGRHQVAITLLSRALHESPSVGQDDRQRIGMLYLLAYANEALQRRDEARIHYQRVFQTDSSFRDVAARLAALSRRPT